MSIIKSLIISLRPAQWIKNIFILAPSLFYGSLFNTRVLSANSLCFVYFSLISSAVYLINDVVDKKEDRLHPIKSKRPIARGEISSAFALAVSAVLVVLSIWGIILMQSSSLGIIVIAYIVLNVFYSIFLKHKVVLDVISIALGFELRVWAGAVIINIIPSAWLQVCTFLLALFLGFAKRRAEILMLRFSATEHRRVLASYRLVLLDQFIAICAGVIILAYSLYTLSQEVLSRPRGNYMIYTVPFVVYGIFRYLYLMHIHKKGDDPAEIVFCDKPLFINLLLWAASIFLIIYI